MSRKPNNQARNREIAKRVRAGEAPKAIAPDYGLSAAARVRRICREAGIRPSALQNRERQELQARNREIAKRVRAGEAPKAIAPDYGLSAARVRHICQKERARPNEPRSWKPVGRLGMP